MLCDMLRWSMRGSWRAGRMVSEVLARSRCSSCCIMGVKAAAERTWAREIDLMPHMQKAEVNKGCSSAN
jgi:hypothetical protein